MVDVSQDVIIREEDCHVTHGIKVSEISENGQVIEKFSDRLRGRFLVAMWWTPIPARCCCPAPR